MSSIENSICDSIQAFVDKGVREAPYDVTILGQIVDNSEAAAGFYRVKYQDSVFTVMNLDKEKVYDNEAFVLIHVPGNDYNSTYKTIIGTIEDGKVSITSFLGWNVDGNKLISPDQTLILDPLEGLTFYSDSTQSEILFQLNLTTHTVIIRE